MNIRHRTPLKPPTFSSLLSFTIVLFLYFTTVHSKNSDDRSTIEYLDGSRNSYLQYPGWQYFFDTQTPSSSSSSSSSDQNRGREISPVQSASLSLEFQLHPEVGSLRPSAGLLLFGYSPETELFVQVKILSPNGIRFWIDGRNSEHPSDNVIELKQGLNFTDGLWHRLEITRHFSDKFPDEIEDSLLEENKNKNIPANSDGSEDETIDDHKTEKKHREAITIKVDSEIIQKRISLPKYNNHDSSTRTNLIFIGGTPIANNSQQNAGDSGSALLSRIQHELHLRGAIRNVQYTSNFDNENDNENSADVYRHQRPINIGKSSTNVESQCSTDQCKNGGYCTTTSAGLECDCSSTEYSGAYCQLSSPSLETTIHGDHLASNPAAWLFISNSEQFEIEFRSRHANGLLLFTSDVSVKSFLMISLRNAAVVLQIRLGEKSDLLTVEPNNVRFDDNQWHRIVVGRKIRQISSSTFLSHFSITVDSTYTQHGSASDIHSHFVSSILRIGAIESQLTASMNAHHEHSSARLNDNDPNSLPAITTISHRQPHSFSGCLRKIIYTADSVRLDLLKLASEHSQLLVYHTKHSSSSSSSSSPSLSSLFTSSSSSSGATTTTTQRLATSCDSNRDAHTDPITFTTPESYLKVPHGWNGRKQGVLTLKFRTNQSNGVLLYAFGASTNESNNGTVLGSGTNMTSVDYFALELLDGHLYMLLYLGSTPIKVAASNRRVDDSRWHSVKVERIDRKGEIILDDSLPVSFHSPGASQHLDLSPEIYLGGLSRFSHVPPELWSASLGSGFVGCIRDFVLDHSPIDIASLARAQDSGSIKSGCHANSSSMSCENVCLNGGKCYHGWNRVQCDCSATAFTGSTCSKDATIYSFNGEQFFQVSMSKEMKSQAESFSLRFKTDKSDGLLLTTTHHRASHQFLIYLHHGKLTISINFGEKSTDNTIQIGDKLNDDQWHTVSVERRGLVIHAEIDGNGRKQTQLSSAHYTLFYDTIQLGSRIYVGKIHPQHGSQHLTSFVGYMQNFIMNGQLYFELARDGQLTTGSTRITAKLGRKDRVLSDVATFKSKFTYVALPQLRAYSSLSVHFQFKTRDANCLLFYNGGSGRDFVALELVAGRLNFIFDLGDGARRIQSKSSSPPLNDNRWHSVTLGRPWLYEHTMLVDDEQHSSQLSPVSGSSNTPINLHLDLDGLLFVGGVREEMWSSLPRIIKSRNGFEGCIASLELNGESVSLTGPQVLVASTLVEQGCSAPVTRCSSTACANRGVCVQLWNSYTCDCDLTSFSGPTCQDGTESTAFQFGPTDPGLITFSFDESNRPDTRNDLLALGFLTSNPNAVLIRVDSATTADYLQLEIADGNVLIVYNLGTEDIDIGDLDVKVDDGQYHIVRFTRTGQNSTLQIDNHNIISRNPAGNKQMNIFNAHAKIQIGGKKNVLRNTIDKSFAGIMAGLVFNGHRLLDIAAEEDSRIKIEGEIEAMISIRNQNSSELSNYATPSSVLINNNDEQMQAEPKSSGPTYPNSGPNDDLIYPGAGSGCFETNAGNDDDEENAEQCAHLHQDGSGDDLITPVYVAVNRLRPTSPSAPKENWNQNRENRCNDDDDDDDDCVEGSGSAPYENDNQNYNNNNNNNNRNNYNNNNNNNNYNNNYNNQNNNYSDGYSGSAWTTWQPPTVPPMSRPPFSNGYQPPMSPYNTIPPFYYGGASNAEEQERILSSLRPKTTAPSWTKPIYSVAGPAKPPPIHTTSQSENGQEPPEIYEVPLNIPEPSNDTDPNQNQMPPPPPPEVLTRASNDRTVMIIGMIAICLIVVVIIAPIVLFFKVRLQAPDPAYKIESMFGATPKFGTLPVQGAGHGHYPTMMPVSRAQSINAMNATSAQLQQMQQVQMAIAAGQMGRLPSRPPTRPGTPTHMDPMTMKKKDAHEWYV